MISRDITIERLATASDLLLAPFELNEASLGKTLALIAEHQVEIVGAKLRDMMPWIKKNKLVDQSKN